MSDPLTATINFGKHKGKSFLDLAETQGRYLLWLYTCDWVKAETKKIIEFHFNRIKLEFGKYKDKTVGMVKECDPKYFAWLTKPFVDTRGEDKQVTC